MRSQMFCVGGAGPRSTQLGGGNTVSFSFWVLEAAGMARDGRRPKTNARETVKRKERNGRIVDDEKRM